ncbi:MAG: RsmE family RNA methyltransferase [Candidatus Omnitrophota bacterium]|jgi:16S rRNA (uracil1498-N3)-methyltransferase
MHRFFCRNGTIKENTIHITDKTQLHHIRDVLRFKPHDEIFFFDETGFEYTGTVTAMDKETLTVSITGRKKTPSLRRPFITIACAIPKQTKMEDIVDKLTQLDVDRIIPMITERVIVQLDQHKKMLKLSRWEKIAVQASQQSMRKTLPIIGPVLSFTEVLAETSGFKLKIIPTLEGEQSHIREIMHREKIESVAALIGPEGDFTPTEVAVARQHGFIPVSLGETILRVDTAAIAMAALLSITGKTND